MVDYDIDWLLEKGFNLLFCKRRGYCLGNLCAMPPCGDLPWLWQYKQGNKYIRLPTPITKNEVEGLIYVCQKEKNLEEVESGD